MTACMPLQYLNNSRSRPGPRHQPRNWIAGGFGGPGGRGQPSATKVDCAGGNGGMGQPSATRVDCPGGNGGMGQPSATRVECPGGNGGMGQPSARISITAARTIEVNTARIKPLNFREFIAPPKKSGMGRSVSHFLTQSNARLGSVPVCRVAAPP